MQQEVERLGCELQQARAEVAAAAQEEARVRAAAAPMRQRQWQARGALTQLTQQPPPELFACNQADDDDATQAELWKVQAQLVACAVFSLGQAAAGVLLGCGCSWECSAVVGIGCLVRMSG